MNAKEKIDTYLAAKNKFEEIFPELFVYAFDPGLGIRERKEGSSVTFVIPLWFARMIFEVLEKKNENDSNG